MAVTVYKSTDSLAPILTGLAGTLIDVLDACLVNGYGATAAAGWTKPFTGTNKAVYRQGTGSSQLYLRLDDTNSIFTMSTGYETMSSVDVGTGPFPNTKSVIPNGVFWNKSNIGTSASRAWMVIANERAFYLWINTSNQATPFGLANLYFFGDIKSYKTVDAYKVLIEGSTSSTGISNMYLLNTTGQVLDGHYMPRPYTQLGSVTASNGVGKHTDTQRCGSFIGQGTLAYPDPINSNLILSPIWIHEITGNSSIRGILPGGWAPGHTMPLTHEDTFSGTGNLAGKTFVVVNNAYNTNTNYSQIMIETSDTWYS